MPLYCEYASVSNSGAIERNGIAALPDMAELVGKAQRVVLLLAANDVTLLRVKVPPLSSARLKLALPNLIEDQLMSDPAECVIVADPSRDEIRTVAVVQRDWLQLLSRTLHTLGARSISALPSQLCLPYHSNEVSAVVVEHGTDIDVAVRTAPQEGIGLSMVADQPESVAFEVMQSLAALAPHAPIHLYVPQTRERDYQDSLHIAPALQERITLHVDQWRHWIDDASKVSIDLMSGFGAAAGPARNWRAWRWPLTLAAAVLAVNIIGLNVDWLRLKREADALRANMVQTYKTAFPKETVIVDPLVQLRQKMAQGGSGAFAPDDFLALSAAVGEALSTAGQSGAPVERLEYRDRVLTVRLKASVNVPLDQLQNALAGRNLTVSKQGDVVLQIRSAK